MPEPCGWCKGNGSMSEVGNFLLARLIVGRDARWIGVSSEGMLGAAIKGLDGKDLWGPMDGWDLGRCMVTRAVAPACLHPAMDKMIARWVRKMNKEQRETRSPFYGVKEARGMLAEHEDQVRAQIADVLATSQPRRGDTAA